MKRRALLTFCCAAVYLLPELTMAEDYLLYEPKPATGEQTAPPVGEGVLVRSVTVKRGDTLSRISRRYIGKAWLFPQVLLFTKIKNPDLIYPGEKVLVPVAAGRTVEAGKETEEKAPVAKRHRRRKAPHAAKPHRAAQPQMEERKVPQPPRPEPAQPPRSVPAPVRKPARIEPSPELPVETRAPESAPSTKEQALYQSAKRAYSAGDYRKAADEFQTFIARYPNSPLASDAALYRADSYLHLSGQP